MRYQYKAGRLHELPAMERPKNDFPINTRTQTPIYVSKLREYEAHCTSLKSYPVTGTGWTEDKIYEEGEVEILRQWRPNEEEDWSTLFDIDWYDRINVSYKRIVAVLKSKERGEIPDITFLEMLTNTFNVDFMTTEELETIVKSGELYAHGKTRVYQSRIAELEDRVNELTAADMTHEYNLAEAERFRPEYERQIIEPYREALESLINVVEGGKDYGPALWKAKELLK